MTFLNAQSQIRQSYVRQARGSEADDGDAKVRCPKSRSDRK